MMTDDEIQAIKERVAKRTPGEWHMGAGFPAHVYARPTGPESWTVAVVDDGARELEDADFIAHAPADIDALLADNEALQARVEELEAALGNMLERYDQGGCGITLRPCGACLWCRARKALDGAK